MNLTETTTIKGSSNMKASETFPKEYEDNPLRRAERRVYEELLACDLPGLFIYEWKWDKHSAELDFVIWIEEVGLFSLQVKGGRYRYQKQNGEDPWQLRKDGTWERVPSPIRQTWSGTEGLLKALPKRNGYRTFVLPALLFPDMDDLGSDIETEANRQKVYVLADERGLANKLAAIAHERGVHVPPDADAIDADVRAITGGEVSYLPGREDGDAADHSQQQDKPSTLQSDRVDIRHVEHYHHVDQSLHLHLHGPLSPDCIAAITRTLRRSTAFHCGE